MVVLCLGGFVFSMDTALYHELQRQRSWKHATSSRVGARDASQYNGIGDDTITVSGLIAPGQLGNAGSLAELVAMADAGDAYVLADMLGTIHGVFTIREMSETQSYHDFLGIAQKIEFTMTLHRVDPAQLSATVDGGTATSTAAGGSLDKAPVPDAPAYVKPKKPVKKAAASKAG